MKTRSTQSSYRPSGYTGDMKHFNRWQKDLQRSVDKLRKTKVVDKLN